MKHDTVLDHVTEVMMFLLYSLKIIHYAYSKRVIKAASKII